MKIKQTVEENGRFVKPDMKELLVPEIIVCPECGSLIYPLGDDQCRTYYFPNMTNEHRYYTKHYARASFTCAVCSCKFSRTANTYTDLNWEKIALDISKVIAILFVVIIILCSLDIGIHNIIARIIVIILSSLILLVLLKHYWGNS